MLYNFAARNIIMAVQFSFADSSIALTERKQLKSFIESIFTNEGKILDSLTVVFCSDDYLLEINRQFLQHDYYTDIITFDLSIVPEGIIGELYISADRVRDNARIHGVSIQRELHRVIFHGSLHLCGYKDKTKKDKLLMTCLEDANLLAYFK